MKFWRGLLGIALLLSAACDPAAGGAGAPLDTGAVEASSDAMVPPLEDTGGSVDGPSPRADAEVRDTLTTDSRPVLDDGDIDAGGVGPRDVGPLLDGVEDTSDGVAQDVPVPCEVALGLDGEGTPCPWPDTVEELVRFGPYYYYYYPCAIGQNCNRALDPARCQPPQCEGAPCFYSGNCQGDFVCVPGDPPRCGPRQAVGGPCSRSEGCLEGLVCDQGMWRCRVPEREGEPCAADEPWCPGECVLPVGFWRDQGAPCGMYQIDDDYLQWYECVWPLACTYGLDAPRCEPPQCEGAVCGACQAGLTCLPGHRCGPVGGEGSACDTDSDCFDPLLCNSATWTCTVGGQGDPCRYAFHDCQEGPRCNVAAGVGGEGLCWASLSGAEGDPRERLEDCQRPLVCQPSGRYGVCVAP